MAIDYAPTVISTAPVNVPQGTTDASLNLAAVFNNPNGPLSQLTFSVVGNSNASLVPAAWVEDQTLEFAAAQGLSGTSNVTILATDPAGESVQATVPIVLNALPAAPSGLTATAASTSEIDLAWTNNAAAGTAFQVQRATNSSFTQNLTTVTTTAANATSCGDTSLTAATTYYYRVFAVNAAGSSAASNTASAATQATSTLPAGWSDADIGGPSPAGSALCSGSIYTVTRRRGGHLERGRPVQLRLPERHRRPDAHRPRDLAGQHQRLGQGGRDGPRQSPLHLRGRGRG